MKAILQFLACLLLSFGAAALGSTATTPSIATWYAALNKPPFNPPNWIFGPVWTLLFFLMAVSLFRVWQKGWQNRAVKKATTVFIGQLILNVLWSVAFFGMHFPLLALVIIFALWLLILQMIKIFGRIDALAGKLQVPYLLWVSFASILNLSIVLLNR